MLDRGIAQTLNVPVQTGEEAASKFDYIVCSANIGPDVLPLPQVPFALTDMTTFRMAYSDLAGILGANLLNNFALRFDLSGRKLDLISPGNIAGTEYEPKDAVKVPLTYDGEHYLVQAQLDGRSVSFIIDTGADRTSIEDRSIAAGLQASTHLTGYNLAVATAAGDSALLLSGSLLRLHKLTIGSIQWLDPVIQTLIRPSNAPLANALGVDFLQRYRVLLDLPAKMMYLSPQPDFHADAEEFVQTGLGISFEGAQAVVAQVLSPSSAQEAGLHVGDKVMTINGSVPQSGAAEELNSVVSKPKSKHITLTVRHLGETRLVEVTLKVRKLL